MNQRELLEVIGQASRESWRRLDLGYCRITELPPEVSCLVSLEYLDLSGNQLVNLPSELYRLSNLVVLDLSSNELTKVSAKIGQLVNLKWLSLGDNQLTRLPSAIQHLANLVTLYLSNNNIEWLPPEFERLVRLENLYLDRNRFVKLPAGIEKLTKLRWFDLSNNQIRKLPPEIGFMTSLTHLDLGNNRIDELSPEIGRLTQLQTLDLRNNQLGDLPLQSANLAECLSWLLLHNNPLSLPPEILGNGRHPSTIITYYFENIATHARTRYLSEVKMLLVGQGGVGKTSLVKRLVVNEFDPSEAKTEGIEIRIWSHYINNVDIRINIWDFGGQEIMHATHKFFLTHRSLYLLVVDARQGEIECRLEYWLKMIQIFAGDSPIIVVSNKIDEHLIKLNQRSLLEKYPTIKAFIYTSCKTGEGIAELKIAIEQVASAIPHIYDRLAISWFDVKEQLERMRGDFITYKQYRRICLKRGIRDDASQRTLLQFLNDLGIVLNFSDDRRLEDTNILNPKWVTNGVYAIINNRDVQEEHGEFHVDQLNSILDPVRYPRDKHLFIIDMMRRFELLFDFDGQRDTLFLIPELLPVEEPPHESYDLQNTLGFEYHYDVLPSSIITRFIVRMKEHISEKLYWRTGVRLSDNSNWAFVIADLEERRVSIYVGGDLHNRRDYLSLIRSDFKHIHSTFPGLKVKEMVTLPQAPGIAVEYQLLLVLESKGIQEYIFPGYNEFVEIQPLLEGISSSLQRSHDRVVYNISMNVGRDVSGKINVAGHDILGKEDYLD